MGNYKNDQHIPSDCEEVQWKSSTTDKEMLWTLSYQFLPHIKRELILKISVFVKLQNI